MNPFSTTLTVLALLSAAVARTQAPVSPPKPAPVSSNASAGAPRYQIVFGPFARADIFLLDTQTGKIWSRTVFSFLEGDPEAWVHEPHPESAEELKYWIDSHQIKPSKLPPTKTSSDGRPVMPDLNTFAGTMVEYTAAVKKYEADFEAWALDQRVK